MKIEEKYPDLFKHVFCECGGGWHGIMGVVCEKLKDRGIRFAQIKEKFGTLRIYLDSYPDYRIGNVEVLGLKDGKIVEKETPESEPLIKFCDSKRVDMASGNNGECRYLPGSDQFLNSNSEPTEVEDKEFIKGRLAELTGLVGVEPIEEESTDDIIEWAELESSKTCEGCGTKEGVTREGGWIKTLCPKCRAKPNWWDDEKIKFEKADDDQIEELYYEIHSILEILGHPEAMVTDESKIWDFTFMEPDKIKEISSKIGFEVTQSDYLVDIAKKLKER